MSERHHHAEHPHVSQASHQKRQHSEQSDVHPGNQGPALRTTDDPYPFVYSKDPFDARRYTTFGRVPILRTSRGETIFAVVVIVAVLGVGLFVILASFIGR